MTTAFFVLAWGDDCDATQRAWAKGELEVWRLVPVSLGLTLCLSLSLSCQAHARLLGTCSCPCPCPPPGLVPVKVPSMAVDLRTVQYAVYEPYLPLLAPNYPSPLAVHSLHIQTHTYTNTHMDSSPHLLSVVMTTTTTQTMHIPPLPLHPPTCMHANKDGQPGRADRL